MGSTRVMPPSGLLIDLFVTSCSRCAYSAARSAIPVHDKALGHGPPTFCSRVIRLAMC